MKTAQSKNGSEAEDICLACGLCCNGVIFGDVRLQAGDDAERLQTLGLSLAGRRCAPRLTQPCAAFDGCRCRIYGERPRYCREFECLLLKRVKAGRLTPGAALRTIRAARQRAGEVRRMLRELGDTDEAVSLGDRFRRTRRRLDAVGADGGMAETYGLLTLAMHELNLLLSDAFYPGATG